MVTKSSRSGRWVAIAAALAAVAILVSCGESTEIVEGECRDVYGAAVCTWASWDGETLDEFGVSFPMAAAENVPESMEMTWPPAPIAILALPEGVGEATGFSHFELNWEHHGHQPRRFLEPHFDFHFYSIPSDDLGDIDCRDASKPEVLPEGYTLPDAMDPEQGLLTGLCVPSMGMHAMPVQELETPGTFDATILVGYYAGDVIFVEPMVSQRKLLEAEAFALPVPSLEGLVDLNYPMTFRADFDEATRTYNFVFSDFARG